MRNLRCYHCPPPPLNRSSTTSPPPFPPPCAPRPRQLRRARRGDGSQPPGDHRPGHRRSADHQRGRHGRRRPERRDLQLPRAARGAARARPRVALARRHRGDRPPRRGPRPVELAGASTACSRSPSGTSAGAARPRPRSGGQEAALLLVLRRPARVRQRDQGAVRRSLGAAAPRPKAIPAYLNFGYVPTPRTFFEGVRSLPPGHVLSFEAGGEPVIERYWQPPVAGIDGAAHARPLAARGGGEVRSRLEDAVARRLISDVPLGAFLSGGIDSSAVVGIMASQLDRPVQTFTIGFEDREGFDERPYARLVASATRTDHHEFVVQPEGGRPGRAPGLASRPAVRRLERGADLPAQRADPRRGHGRAVGRRRRRGVRGL